MNIKNLLIVPLLGAALVATSACSPSAGGSTSGTETPASTSGEQQKVVTRVVVKAVQQVVQDDVLDFDTLVTVYYDDDTTSKDYTLEVAAASKDLVTVSGKKATFVKEGTVNITVKAGAQSAKFSTEVISKVKKEANEYFSAITNNYASAVTEDGEKFDVRKIHRPNYVFNLSYPNDTTNPFNKGSGYLKFENGHTYSYKVADGALGSVTKIDANYEDLFATMDLNARVLEGTTLTDEAGVDYVRIDSGLASEWAEYGFYSQVHFFIWATTGLDITLPYDSGEPEVGTEYTRWEALNFYKIEDAQEGQPGFEILATSAKYVVAEYEKGTGYAGENDTMKEGTEEFEMSIQIAALKEDEKAVPFIEDFIADPNNEPASKDFTLVEQYCEDTLGAAPYNYSVAVTGTAFSGTSVYFTYSEQIASTEEAVETVFSTNNIAGFSNPDIFPEASNEVTGYAIHSDDPSTPAVYSYVKDGDTNPATLVENKTSIFGDAELRAETFAQLSASNLWGENFYVSTLTKDAEKHTITYSLSVADSLNFIKAAFQGSKTGRYIAHGFDSFWNPQYLDEILGYGAAQIVVALDSSEMEIVSVSYRYQTNYFASLGSSKYLGIAYGLTFSGVGEAAVDLSNISWAL